MAKFRKKPIIIDAILWTGFNGQELADFIGTEANINLDNPLKPDLIIHTKEGDMRGNPGDWIIKGVKGEFYPCKPDIFEQSYERIV